MSKANHIRSMHRIEAGKAANRFIILMLGFLVFISGMFAFGWFMEPLGIVYVSTPDSIVINADEPGP